jgi:hypothetical protein
VIVERIFQYRTLVGKCDLGIGLSWEEIELLGQIEGQFAPSADDLRMRTGRRFRRESVALRGLMRGDRIHDQVEVIELGPGGLVCRAAPYVARGEQIELAIETRDESYRFSARGVWMRDDDDDYRLGFMFVGMPVQLRRVAVSAHEADLVDRISESKIPNAA